MCCCQSRTRTKKYRTKICRVTITPIGNFNWEYDIVCQHLSECLIQADGYADNKR